MFAIFTDNETHKVKNLQKLALPLVANKALRYASKLSLRFGTDIYFYNTSGNREIKRYSSIDFINESIEFIILEDDRIAVKNAPYLSAIWPEIRATKYFKYFEKRKLPI